MSEIIPRRKAIKRMAGIAAASITLPYYVKRVLARENFQQSPNIVFIAIDDIGMETLDCYGGQSYTTPNINAFSQKALQFQTCFASSLCSPSRAQLMTGRYPCRTGVIYTVVPDVHSGGLDETKEVPLATLLKNAGYVTGITGKWSLYDRSDGLDDYQAHISRCGFDEQECYYSHTIDYWSGNTYYPDVYNNWALSFIENHKNEPFYLQYSLGLVHYPFDPTPLNPNGPLDNISNFPYMMEYMDKMAGNVIDKIEEAGISENTLIIFAGDNGTDERITSKWNGYDIEGGKFSLMDTGCWVPLLCYWKGVTTAGTNSDLIDFCDFLPTICELAGASIPTDRVIDGRSFVPQLRGEAGTPREWVSLQVREKNGPFRKCVRDKKWKLFDDSGELYDVTNTPVEERFISVSEQTPEDAEARSRLQKIIDNDFINPTSIVQKTTVFQSAMNKNSYRIAYIGEDVRMDLSPEIGKNLPIKASVYTSNGRKVTSLTIKNGKFFWDGRDSHGYKVRSGFYFMKFN